MKIYKVSFLVASVFLFSCTNDTDLLSEQNELSGASALKGGSNKVEVCHFDSVTGEYETLTVSSKSAEKHLAHGDYLGQCDFDSDGDGVNDNLDLCPDTPSGETVDSDGCSFFQKVGDGLVAWYPFNGNANDESGNANNGTPQGNVVLENDRYGNPQSSYYFPGQTDSYINVLQNSSFSQFQEGFTLSLWARFIDYNLNSRIVEIGNTDGQSRGFTMSANSGLNKWTGNINNGQGAALGTAIPPSTIPVDTWEHLVITFNFSTGISKTYINGVLVAEESSGISPYVNNFGTLDLSDRLFNIGRKTAPAFDPWEGSVDDIGIWNRVLTDEEVEYLYNN